VSELGPDTPALVILLGVLSFPLDMDGTPQECDGAARCPFCVGETESPHDPAESYFHCSLLDRRVWGEEPACEFVDWQRRAREELDA
jgi:hypothetical protein